MLKFLLIVAIILWLLYKIGSFFFRAGAASQHFRNYQGQEKKDSSARQDHNSSKNGKSGKFNGGEYIDYEEVKK
jgi:hypothetical protein